MDLHERYGLRRVINAYDKATFLGGARVLPEIAEVVSAGLAEPFEIDDLQAAAGRAIAAHCGAEAGCVTACAAAAITLGVASCMTGTDRERVAQLPDTTGMPGRVVIQRGHCVSFGAPVEQMIRLSGAEVVAVGDEERCRAEDVEAALGEDVAAVFAVESYHTVDYDGLKLHELAEVAHASGVPLLVDAATQELRLREIVAMGPDLVGCSAHKYFASTTAGIVAGRADLVAGVLAQNVGIGRGMKVGKEGILGVIAAMDTPMQTDTAAWSRAERRKVERIVERLSGVPGLEATISPDPNGCPFGRVRLTLDEGGAHTPQSLRTALAEGDPAIHIRIYGAEPDAAYLNATEMTDAEVEVVCDAIAGALGGRAALTP